MPYDVESCPHCGEPHRFYVEIRAKELMFAGKAKADSSGRSVSFTCPVSGLLVTKEIPNPIDGEVIGPADNAFLSTAAGDLLPGMALGNESAHDDEFNDWLKDSRSIAIAFSNTMLTASTGAIPIYFGIMKYLGQSKVDSSFFARASVVPPVLFLFSAVSFVFALRPIMSYVSEDEFREFRRQCLKSMNRYMIVGSALFGTAILLAIMLLGHILL